MSNFTTFSTQIKTVLQAVQQSGSAAFVDVLEYPSNKFTGFPSATVVPSDVQSDYATVKQNRRRYVFNVYLYYSLENSNQATAYTNMRILIDTVLDALDKSNDLSGNADFVTPVPMQWGVQETESGVCLVAPVNVICEKDIALY